MAEKKLRKRCLQYMKAQLKPIFDMETASKSSSKLTAMADLEDTQDPAEDELSENEL